MKKYSILGVLSCGIVGGTVMWFYKLFAPEYLWYGYFTCIGVSILLGIVCGFLSLYLDLRKIVEHYEETQ